VETRGLDTQLISIDNSFDIDVVFDVQHLREVVLNLLSNAVRYASGNPGSIRIFIQINSASRPELHIHDDGPGIDAEVRAHLFEPFYTTSSRGTGLGLYMARELCLNNHALLDYEYRIDHADATLDVPVGRFIINFSPLTAALNEL